MHNPPNFQDRDIHAKVLNDVKDLLTRLPQKASNPQLAKALAKLEELTASAHEDLDVGIQSLQKYANWDVFTIAFYGETNAGKSTTIETLRAVLGEKTMTESRQKFREVQEKNGLSRPALTALQIQISDAKNQLQQFPTQIDEQKAELLAEANLQNTQVEQLREKIATLKANSTLFQKLLNFVRKLPEEKQLSIEEKALANLKQANEATRTQLDAKLRQTQNALQQLQSQFDRFAEELAPWSDGQIVGPGSPDYTADTKAYCFQAGGQNFKLLDVPGIEGKEAKVMDSIMGAVKSAHAVFYVTGKATAPQTGDLGSPGTLEKIREHLGDQTEVWSIFNKRITNPMQLEKPELLTDGEKDSLKVLDETMSKHLGEQYKGCISISAQPAFLAIADCLVPMSDLDVNRAKFLKKMSAQDALARTGVAEFVRWLTQSMVSDSDKRIRAANLKKVATKIHNTAQALLTEQRDVLEPLCRDVQADWAKVREQLESEVNLFGRSINAIGQSEIQNIETKLRQEMYKKIAEGIDNEKVRPLFEQTLECESKLLEQSVQGKMTQKLSDFGASVSERLQRFQERVDELQNANRSMNSMSFSNKPNLNFKFDNGINYAGLAASLIGGVLMLWNPAGWVLLGIGAFTAVVGLVKAVWGWFDGDFKKNEQRKAVTKNLNQLKESMMVEFEKASATVIKEITQKTEQLQAEVEASVEQTRTISIELKGIAVKLQKMSKSIS
jgi:hypothetical protein